MLPKDYVRLRLSGDSAIDMADASGTLLLDVAKRRWSNEIFAKTGIDLATLPKLFESQDIAAPFPKPARKSPGFVAALRLLRARAIKLLALLESASRAPELSARLLELPASSSPQPIGLRSIRKDVCTRSATRFRIAGT